MVCGISVSLQAADLIGHGVEAFEQRARFGISRRLGIEAARDLNRDLHCEVGSLSAV